MRVYIISNGRVTVGETVSETQATSIVRYTDLDGVERYVQRLNRALFNTAHDAGEALDEENAAFNL